MAETFYLNGVRVLCATTGQGTLSLGAKYSNAYMTPTEAGAVDGRQYRYRIEEGVDFEIGSGVWNSASNTLTRATVHNSSIAGTVGTTKLTLAGNATVRFVESKEDFEQLVKVTDVQSFTAAQKQTALKNIGVDQVTTHGDSDMTIAATDRTVATSAALTAPRTWTLPAATAFNAGEEVVVADVFGGVSLLNTLTVAPNGSDTLNGVNAGIKLGEAFAKMVLKCDGTSKFEVVKSRPFAVPFDAMAYSGMQVNGNMEVSEENGTTAVTLTGTGALQTKYLLDGVYAAYRGTFVAAAQQVTDAPTGYNNSLKFTVSTAEASMGANDELTIVVPVEGYRVAKLWWGAAGAVPIGIGFWAKFHRTGTYSGSVSNVTPAGGSPRSYPFNFTISVADTWEWKTIFISAGDTTGTWFKANTAGIFLSITIAAGSSRVGTAGAWAGSSYSGVTGTTNGIAATSDIAQVTGAIILPGVDLPTSEQAPRIMRPYPQELDDCLRYLEVIAGTSMSAIAYHISTTQSYFSYSFKKRKRTAPGAPVVSAVGDFNISANGSGNTVTALANGGSDVDGGYYLATVASGLIANNAGLFLANTGNARFKLKAQL